MSLLILRESFLNKLGANIRSNISHYREDEPWIEGLPSGAKCSLDSHVALADLDLDEPNESDLKDVENSIKVHQTLKALTPLQARDPRLWTRLTHVECWEYMRKRWDVERYAGNEDKVVRFIESRYFILQNQSRALVRNGLSRLWWYAHLTHDPERPEPYELTHIVLNSLDITQQVLENNFGRIRPLTTAFLEFLRDHEDELLGSGDAKRQRVRRLAKHINLRGGVCVLDCLPDVEVTSTLESELERIMANEDDEENEDEDEGEDVA